MSHELSNGIPLWRINEWFQTLSGLERSLLKTFHSDLLKWTKSINLISKNTVHESDRIHMADSILGCQSILDQFSQNDEIWDLGSGNGFPGVVLSILLPSHKVVCCDSDSRKVAFIKQFALSHGLKNLETRCERIENLSAECFSSAVTRGLGSIALVDQLCEKKVSPGAKIFHFKGSEWQKEISEAEKSRSEWKIDLHGSYFLPRSAVDEENSVKRWVVRSQKT